MELLERIVRAVQVITAVTAAAFAILLFTNEPQQAAPVPKSGTPAGPAIFATRCAVLPRPRRRRRIRSRARRRS